MDPVEGLAESDVGSFGKCGRGAWEPGLESADFGIRAAYLVRLGCREAVNLDGGGSSTLWVLGRVMNSPSDGMERPVANGLVVLQKERPSVERVR